MKLKLNSLDGPLHMHCCLFDIHCIAESIVVASPLRLHWRGKEFTLISNDRRSAKMFRDSVPVKVGPRASREYREALEDLWHNICQGDLHYVDQRTQDLASENHNILFKQSRAIAKAMDAEKA